MFTKAIRHKSSSTTIGCSFTEYQNFLSVGRTPWCLYVAATEQRTAFASQCTGVKWTPYHQQVHV